MPEEQPGGKLLAKSASDPALQAALVCDGNEIIQSGVIFKSLQNPDIASRPEDLLVEYQAVYLPTAAVEPPDHSAIASDRQLESFTENEFLINGVSVVSAVTCGRKATKAILHYLDPGASKVGVAV